jgi:prevent-host-death family protein
VATQISQRELRNDCVEILRRVERGERLVVTRRGIPVADLVPHETSDVTHRVAPSHSTRTSDLVAAFADLPTIDAATYLADIRAVDEFLDDDDRDVWG